MRLAVLLVVAATSLASAEPNALPDRLVLPADGIEARVTFEIETIPRHFAEPLSIAPDLWLGVTSRLTVGMIHSTSSVSRIDRGASFCVTHTPAKTQARTLGCDRTYTNAGLDVRYALPDRGAWSFAMRGRLLARDVDPWKPALTAGALVRWRRDWLAITTDAYLRFGLANTERGNRTYVNLPIVASVQPVDKLVLAFHTGYDTDLAVFHDGFHIPVALSARTYVTRELELGVLGGFTSAVGPQDTTLRRVLWIWNGGHVGAR